MLSIGSSELIVILVVALIIVGPKRLPEILKGAAKVYKSFMDAFNEAKKEIEDDVDDINIKKDIEQKWKEMLEDESDKKK
jgi:Tat protein translocase TatB subunit